MARVKITTTSTGPALFSSGGGGASVTIDLDETAFGAEEFNTVIGGLTISATTILESFSHDEEPPTPTIITVPDDQVQNVSELNSGTDHPGGLLIVPASAVRINFPGEDQS